MATPFKAILKFKGADGITLSYPCTISDVTTEFYIFPDGNSDVVLPSNHGTLALMDLVLSAAGADTSIADIYVNGKQTGERILNAANLGTNFSRQYTPNTPMFIAAGSRLRIKQLTWLIIK